MSKLETKNLFNARRFFMRKQIQPTSISYKYLVVRRRIISYTVGYQLKQNSEEKSAIPGSLEENIEVPEDYLDIKRSRQFPKNEYKIKSRKYSEKLNPIDIYAKEELIRANRLNSKPEIGKDAKKKIAFKSNETIANKNANKLNEKIISDVVENEVMDLYQNIRSRIKPKSLNTTFRLKTTKITQNYSENKQERILARYTTAQKQCNRSLNRTCTAVGRRPVDSIIERSKAYRQKTENSKNINAFFTNKDWYLGLRNDDENREYRQTMIPIGLPFDNLWMRMLDDPNKKESIIKIEEINRKGESIINKDSNEFQEIMV